MKKRGCRVIFAARQEMGKLEKIAQKHRAKAIVLNTTALNKIGKGNVLVLRPLIGATENAYQEPHHTGAVRGYSDGQGVQGTQPGQSRNNSRQRRANRY